MRLYAIKDVKVGYWKPFVQHNDSTAHREFANMVNSKTDSFVTDNFQDLELWSLGSYDENTGVIESDVNFIVNGSSVHKEV